MEETIEESKQIIRTYKEQEQKLNDKVDAILEEQVLAQKNKYKNMNTVVEPNLSKRMELRKERAR